MRILFDQGTPVPLRDHISGHRVETAYERGWSQLENGDLLNVAENDGFEVLITTDQNLRYQQNLSARVIAILVIKSTSWPLIQEHATKIQTVVNSVSTGDYLEILIP